MNTLLPLWYPRGPTLQGTGVPELAFALYPGHFSLSLSLLMCTVVGETMPSPRAWPHGGRQKNVSGFEKVTVSLGERRGKEEGTTFWLFPKQRMAFFTVPKDQNPVRASRPSS